LSFSVQAANLSDCRIESKKNRFVSENRIESKLFSPNWNALAGRAVWAASIACKHGTVCSVSKLLLCCMQRNRQTCGRTDGHCSAVVKVRGGLSPPASTWAPPASTWAPPARACQFGQKSFDSIRFSLTNRFFSIRFGNLINLPLVH